MESILGPVTHAPSGRLSLSKVKDSDLGSPTWIGREARWGL